MDATGNNKKGENKMTNVIEISNCEKVLTDSDRFVAVVYKKEIIMFTRRRNGSLVEQGEKIGIGREIDRSRNV
jgi:hypothetical protein